MMTVVTPIVYVLDADVLSRQFLHTTVRQAGMRVRIAPTASRFLEEYDPCTPGCIIADSHMPQLNSLALLGYLAEQKSPTPVIVVSSNADVATATMAMRAGAIDVITKPMDPDHLLKSTEHAIAYDAKLRRGRSRITTIQSCIESLTPREFQVMELVVAGKSTKMIAYILKASARTIEVHRGRVMKKMKVDSIAELVLRAVACGYAPTIDEQDIVTHEPVIVINTQSPMMIKSA
jgi:two-component system response regulator FixJ